MATIPWENYDLDTTPGCGGWVVGHRGFIVWPTEKKDGVLVNATEDEARAHASGLLGATIHRVDIVLWKKVDKPENKA